MRTSRFMRLAVAITVLAAAGVTSAQDAFPSRTIRLVVPYEAGGTTDLQARIFAPEWSKRLGQVVIVDNRTGAGGAIAAEFVTKSRADGYTLCFCTSTQTVILPLTQPDFPIVPARDLPPVTLLYVSEGVFVVRLSLNVNSLAEFVALVKANPGKLTFGTTGQGSYLHLSGELINNRAGNGLIPVPYKGEPQALNDLMADRIDMLPLSAEMAARLSQAGKLKVLAARGSMRSLLLPNVPTVAEAGFPGAESVNQVGLFVPSGMPAPILEKLYATAAAAVTSPEVKDRFGQGFRVVGNRPEEYAALLREETEKWAKVIKGLPAIKRP